MTITSGGLGGQLPTTEPPDRLRLRLRDNPANHPWLQYIVAGLQNEAPKPAVSIHNMETSIWDMCIYNQVCILSKQRGGCLEPCMPCSKPCSTMSGIAIPSGLVLYQRPTPASQFKETNGHRFETRRQI